jgi:hypothetical protein
VAGKFGHCAGACPTASPAYRATENSTTRWRMQRQITEHIIVPLLAIPPQGVIIAIVRDVMLITGLASSLDTTTERYA